MIGKTLSRNHKSSRNYLALTISSSFRLVAAMILQLPLVEKVYWTALRQGDQYVVMTGLLFFSAILIGGNLLSDLLLAWVNPKIRYQ